jgi:hypothetical protein
MLRDRVEKEADEQPCTDQISEASGLGADCSFQSLHVIDKNRRGNEQVHRPHKTSNEGFCNTRQNTIDEWTLLRFRCRLQRRLKAGGSFPIDDGPAMAHSHSHRSSNEYGRTSSTTTTVTTTATTVTTPAAMFLSPPSKNLTRSSTVPSNLSAQRHRSHLAPEDAFGAASPPRRLRRKEHGDTSPVVRRRRKADVASGGVGGIEVRNRSRKRRRSFKKLLWVDRKCVSGSLGETKLGFLSARS